MTVEALTSELHSGIFGGAAPDALAALVAILATLRDELGNTTIHGLTNIQTWTGAFYPPAQFRSDAGVFDGVSLLGDGAVSDMIWARPALTNVGIDCPLVVGSATAIVPPRQCAPQPAHPAGRCARAGCRGPRPPPARGGALAGPGDRGCRGVRRRLPPSDGRARLQRDDRCHALRLRRQPRR